MLCELETDKVSVEVPAPASGVLDKNPRPEGSTVEAGGKLATLMSGSGVRPLRHLRPGAPAAAAPSACKQLARMSRTRPRPRR